MRSIVSYPSWLWPLLLVLSILATTGGIVFSIYKAQAVVKDVFSIEVAEQIPPPSFAIDTFSQIAPRIGCTVKDSSDIVCRP